MRESRGLQLARLGAARCRREPSERGVAPAGARVVAIFLVNGREADRGDGSQGRGVRLPGGPRGPRRRSRSSARANVRGLGDGDWDEQVADLQYRDTLRVRGRPRRRGRRARRTTAMCRRGTHDAGCRSADVRARRSGAHRWRRAGDGDARRARNAPEDVRATVGALVAAYRDWIAGQRESLPEAVLARRSRGELLQRAEAAAARIEQGFAALEQDALVLEAFRIANAVMAAARRGSARARRDRSRRPMSRPRRGARSSSRSC